MNQPSRSDRWCAMVAVGVLACGGVRSPAADSAAGVANWFETVAEAERLAEQDADQRADPGPAPLPGENRPPRPVAAAIPAAPAPDMNALHTLIDERNRLVRDWVFSTVKRLAAGRRPAAEDIQSLRHWFTIYFRMRAFVPTSRNDPNLRAVTDILERAIGNRTDFVEGRILVANCHLYAGRPDDARAQLEEASRILTERGLNPSPFGLDCCGTWLRLGAPANVAGFVAVLKDRRIVPEKNLGAIQAMVVATHAWHTFRFNDARDYFEISLRRSKSFEGAVAAPGVQGLLADAALFYLVAGNEAARDGKRGAMLLARIPDDNQAWGVRRARAALHAFRAAAAADDEADGLWQSAVRELEACRRESLPTLDREIDEQLAKYRNHQLWFRERPKSVPKADSRATSRRLAGHVRGQVQQ